MAGAWRSVHSKQRPRKPTYSLCPRAALGVKGFGTGEVADVDSAGAKAGAPVVEEEAEAGAATIAVTGGITPGRRSSVGSRGPRIARRLIGRVAKRRGHYSWGKMMGGGSYQPQSMSGIAGIAIGGRS